MADNNGASLPGDTLEFLKLMGTTPAAPAAPQVSAPQAQDAAEEDVWRPKFKPSAPHAPAGPAAPAAPSVRDAGRPAAPATSPAAPAGPGDTMAFLAALSAPSAPASAPRPPSAAPTGEGAGSTVALPPSAPASSRAAAQPAPDRPATPASAARPARRKPVVIKGGPRRVVRSDGRLPESTPVVDQNRFALSSGHALFASRRRLATWQASLVALACLLALALLFALVWRATQAGIVHEQQQDVVGTTSYDGALSLTPSDDGGYYTVFLVTSTATDQDQIGELSQVVLYRYDKGVTAVQRVVVPANLYVAPSSSGGEAHTLRQVLESQSVTRTLKGIDAALGTRLYNVVVCSQDTFAGFSSVLTGAAAPSSLDADSYLGKVRSNLTLQGIVDFCGKVGALDQSSIRTVNVPVVSMDVAGTAMGQASSTSYRTLLNAVVSAPANAQFDEHGNFAGTQYDESGAPILDEWGIPSGARRNDDGSLAFDENGYLLFGEAQELDENGYPVGTLYDDWGNPILDENGNPVIG